MATSTIRERIIAAIVTRLADIRTAKGYNTEAGLYVNRAKVEPNWDNRPYITVFPGEETATQEYNAVIHTFPVVLMCGQTIGSSDASQLTEYLLGDLIECMTAIEWTMAYTSGGTYTPVDGNTLTGATSGATAYIEAVALNTGSWAGGDAAGTFTLRRMTGTFQAENLNVGANLNVATISAAPTGTRPPANATGDLADRVLYVAGGSTEYPGADDLVVGVSATFQVDYQTVSGDPYHQP